MKRFRAAKNLDALDTRLAALEAQRRALEFQAFGAQPAEGARRDQYLGVGDAALRRKLISTERTLHALRRDQQAAAITYWDTVTTETRTKLDDLKSESPSAGWRRDIWWDVLTLFWIVAGAGWLAYGIAGALIGSMIAMGCGWFIARRRAVMRIENIRTGEQTLRSSEGELQRVRHESEHMPLQPLFSASEEAGGVADRDAITSAAAESSSTAASGGGRL